MAGYLFNLNSVDSLQLYAEKGIYATVMRQPARHWRVHQEGTFADYATMKPGDNVYFFIKRKIYGIGKLVKVGKDCKFFNFPEAGVPLSFKYDKIHDFLLWNEGEKSVDQRCICCFAPDPHFFQKGVDMDDILTSNPAAFKMLRAFWKLSFVKVDDDENQAFRDAILKFNQDVLAQPNKHSNIFPTRYQVNHKSIRTKLKTGKYLFSSVPLLESCNRIDYIAHEMAIEAGLLHQLAENRPRTTKIFGKWDYLSHQVIASPFKPIDYMDKTDIFGYAYIPGFKPTKSKFLIIELKKGKAELADLVQLMKYVDWIQSEYCFGDYAMVQAYLVAYGFGQDIIREKEQIAQRHYTIGMKPAKSKTWNDCSLVKYSFDPQKKQLDFEKTGEVEELPF